jgi:hypothetical protein
MKRPLCQKNPRFWHSLPPAELYRFGPLNLGIYSWWMIGTLTLNINTNVLIREKVFLEAQNLEAGRAGFTGCVSASQQPAPGPHDCTKVDCYSAAS